MVGDYRSATDPSTAPVRIIVLSSDTEKSFRWLSDGWYEVRDRNLKERRTLFQLATSCIDDGVDVKDVIRRLKRVGFEIERRQE